MRAGRGVSRLYPDLGPAAPGDRMTARIGLALAAFIPLVLPPGARAAEQTASMERLLGFRFESVLPGYGQRVRLPADELRRQLAELVGRMRDGTG